MPQTVSDPHKGPESLAFAGCLLGLRAAPIWVPVEGEEPNKRRRRNLAYHGFREPGIWGESALASFRMAVFNINADGPHLGL